MERRKNSSSMLLFLSLFNFLRLSAVWISLSSSCSSSLSFKSPELDDPVKIAGGTAAEGPWTAAVLVPDDEMGGSTERSFLFLLFSSTDFSMVAAASPVDKITLVPEVASSLMLLLLLLTLLSVLVVTIADITPAVALFVVAVVVVVEDSAAMRLNWSSLLWLKLHLLAPSFGQRLMKSPKCKCGAVAGSTVMVIWKTTGMLDFASGSSQLCASMIQ